MRLTRAAACRSLAAFLMTLSLAAPALAQRPSTVLELASQQKNLSTFVAAVHTAGLDDMLKSAGPVTVYAPTDEAFAKIPAAERQALLSSPDRLRALLLGHIVKDAITMRDGTATVSSGSATTAGGRDLTFAIDDQDHALVSGARVLAFDLRAGNGTIDTIDRVLLQ
ncbi:MAG TPA: fasciclin domain-containing protein [Candidatus Elarobacter sp.]|jgi:uncharacterized surface protein with fasciclin (FAS1) repeats